MNSLRKSCIRRYSHNWVEDQDAHELFKTHHMNTIQTLVYDLDKQYEAQPGETMTKQNL